METRDSSDPEIESSPEGNKGQEEEMSDGSMTSESSEKTWAHEGTSSSEEISNTSLKDEEDSTHEAHIAGEDWRENGVP